MLSNDVPLLPCTCFRTPVLFNKYLLDELKNK